MGRRKAVAAPALFGSMKESFNRKNTPVPETRGRKPSSFERKSSIASTFLQTWSYTILMFPSSDMATSPNLQSVNVPHFCAATIRSRPPIYNFEGVASFDSGGGDWTGSERRLEAIRMGSK